MLDRVGNVDQRLAEFTHVIEAGTAKASCDIVRHERQALDVFERFLVGPSLVFVYRKDKTNQESDLIGVARQFLVVDCYDTMVGVVTAEFMDQWKIWQQHYDLERFCFEHADGICARNLNPQYAKRCYRITAPTIFFPDYCSIAPTTTQIEKHSTKDGKPHIVYGGTIWPERVYGLTEGAWLWFADIAEQVGFHLHLYPVGYDDDATFSDMFADYIEKDRSSRFFHLHKPVDGEAWTRELARYDYGVSFHYNHLSGAPGKLFTRFASRAGYSNKSTDYMELGIYHRTNPRTLGAWLIEHYRVGEGVDWQRLHQ
ncbi:MAG: hypothetical protein QGH33_14620, partial [Pirellulaceae bacterium]|nr:hypothetical protein [Pirellulaceae bacterium]